MTYFPKFFIVINMFLVGSILRNFLNFKDRDILAIHEIPP